MILLKKSALFALLFTVAFCSSAQNKLNVIIGTYTNTQKSEGIYVYEFDTRTGDLTYKSKATGIENPSYLTVSPDLKHVYAVSEAGSSRLGSVFAYNYNAKTGELAFLNKQSSGGAGPAYVSIDASGKYVFAANYTGGTLAAIPVMQDGSLGEDIQVIKHEGSSIDPARQKKPYVHSTVLSPDNKFLFTPDLGTDKVNIYSLDIKKASNPLAPANPAFVSVIPGSGPRHLTFHPNKKYAYLVQEMKGTVTAFSYNAGKLTDLQNLPMMSEDFKGRISGADIHVSPDGKFLYASNRGEANELTIYAIDSKTGKLNFAGRQSSLGKTPRNFAIDPTGNFLLIANQDTDNVLVFKRDQKTGLLTDTGKKIELGRPVCLKFVEIK